MAYDDNQKTEFPQKTRGDMLYVTGAWEKEDKYGCTYWKTGKMNREGMQNLQQFGDDTVLLLFPITKKHGRAKKLNPPDMEIFAVQSIKGYQKPVSEES